MIFSVNYETKKNHKWEEIIFGKFFRKQGSFLDFALTPTENFF